MRVSNYVIGAPIEDGKYYVLLHGYTGAVDKVPAQVGRFLVEQRGSDCEEVLGVGKVASASLRRRGYLTDLTYEEERQAMVQIATTLHELDLAESPMGFMFVPTYTCNLRCPYCFQGHEMHAGAGRYSTMLNAEQVDQAFRIVDEFSEPGAFARGLGLLSERQTPLRASSHKGAIGLFGGEPLTAASVAIIQYIVQQASVRSRAVSAVTNGVELDHYADLLGPGGLSELQITLDGTAGLHDRRRIGPGFRRTFDRIADNIDLALRKGARVSLRMNVDATNAANLGDLNDFCVDRGWAGHPEFTANAATVTPEGRHETLISPADLVEMTSSLKMLRASVFESYERYAYETLNRCIQVDGYPFQRVATCSAETGLLMFDPLGDVYTCWEEVGDPRHRLGTYDADGLHLNRDVALQWLSRFPGAIDDCSQCPYALIHTSGCAKHAEQASGTIFAPACESFKSYFPRSLGRAYEEFEVDLRAIPRTPVDIGSGQERTR